MPVGFVAGTEGSEENLRGRRTKLYAVHVAPQASYCLLSTLAVGKAREGLEGGGGGVYLGLSIRTTNCRLESTTESTSVASARATNEH